MKQLLIFFVAVITIVSCSQDFEHCEHKYLIQKEAFDSRYEICTNNENGISTHIINKIKGINRASPNSKYCVRFEINIMFNKDDVIKNIIEEIKNTRCD